MNLQTRRCSNRILTIVERLEPLRFLTPGQVEQVANQWGTPVFVYDEETLRKQANEALGFTAPFGLTVRYAMKANPNHHILALFDIMGIEIDASSGYEAQRAMAAGIDPEKILITSQEIPKDLVALIKQGVKFNACSLHQLDEYGKHFPGMDISIRINPGVGSGHSNKTNVGGPASSFGIWHEYTDKIKELVEKYKLTLSRLHTHIGSGTDPGVWMKVARLSLDQVRNFPSVKTLNLGGGFKVARMQQEIGTDLGIVSRVVSEALDDFYRETGRELRLEIEPGTYMVANAGSLITTICDIVDTGKTGYSFLKIDGGMTDILRPSLYGAQHPLVVVTNKTDSPQEYVVVGHCCESGDLLTPEPGDPETLSPRILQKAAIGDRVVVEAVGAYCASMSTLNYNSFPASAEVMLRTNGKVIGLSRRQTLHEILMRESK